MPQSTVDQFTGMRGGDLPNIIIAYLNAMADGQTGQLKISQRAGANLATGQITLAASATLITAARPTRRGITIKNQAATAISIFVGAAGVSTTTGIELKQGESIVVDWSGAIYAIPASGTPTVGYLETYD